MLPRILPSGQTSTTDNITFPQIRTYVSGKSEDKIKEEMFFTDFGEQRHDAEEIDERVVDAEFHEHSTGVLVDPAFLFHTGRQCLQHQHVS